RRGLEEVGDQRVRQVAADRVTHLQPARRINHQGAKAVIEERAVAVKFQVGQLGQFGDFVRGSSQEAPVIGVVTVLPGVGAQDGGGGELGVEGDGKQMPGGGELGQVAE